MLRAWVMTILWSFVAAIVVTQFCGRVLGWQEGWAQGLGVVGFAAMHWFRFIVWYPVRFVVTGKDIDQ